MTNHHYPMRTILFTTTMIVTVPLHAQLINGSFEQNGNATLTGWQWTCNEPQILNEGAPGSGTWHASLEPGHFKGCFPSYLYHPLPWVVNGQLMILSAWIRCHAEEPCMGGFIGLGQIWEDHIALEEQVGSATNEWTYVEITDTVDLADGEAAILVLSAGSIGGPALLDPAHFDGIGADIAMGVRWPSKLSIHHFVDWEAHTLNIASVDEAITGVSLFDLSGRRIQHTMRQTSGTTVHVNLEGLPGGAYFAWVKTRTNERAIRFTTW